MGRFKVGERVLNPAFVQAVPQGKGGDGTGACRGERLDFGRYECYQYIILVITLCRPPKAVLPK